MTHGNTETGTGATGGKAFTNGKNVEFSTHMLNDTGKGFAIKIEETFNTCFNALLTVCPPGREWSMVKTKLEEACFYAKKAMAVKTDNHQY